MHALNKLRDNYPNPGEVCWIGVRSVKRSPVKIVQEVEAIEGIGLKGDHYSARPGSKRQVTLIQEEHLLVIASCLRQKNIDPALLRRNLVVRGINLLALKEKQFRIGEAVLEMSGLCQPCSRMEQQLGPGGYNAMRGHGGITASVISSGLIRIGDKLIVPASSCD